MKNSTDILALSSNIKAQDPQKGKNSRVLPREVAECLAASILAPLVSFDYEVTYNNARTTFDKVVIRETVFDDDNFMSKGGYSLVSAGEWRGFDFTGKGGKFGICRGQMRKCENIIELEHSVCDMFTEVMRFESSSALYSLLNMVYERIDHEIYG